MIRCFPSSLASSIAPESFHPLLVWLHLGSIDLATVPDLSPIRTARGVPPRPHLRLSLCSTVDSARSSQVFRRVREGISCTRSHNSGASTDVASIRLALGAIIADCGIFASLPSDNRDETCFVLSTCRETKLLCLLLWHCHRKLSDGLFQTSSPFVERDHSSHCSMEMHNSACNNALVPRPCIWHIPRTGTDRPSKAQNHFPANVARQTSNAWWCNRSCVEAFKVPHQLPAHLQREALRPTLRQRVRRGPRQSGFAD